MKTPNLPRLYVEHALVSGQACALNDEQSHYLVHVMRLREGAHVLLFNGRDGEWLSQLQQKSKKAFTATPVTQTALQTHPHPLRYLFAPLKSARLDYMVQKATEMGVATLEPVFTQHTVAARVNEERMRKNAIEAAEQCAITHIPQIILQQKLTTLLAQWPADTTIIFCDETLAGKNNPLATLQTKKLSGSIAVLIGPEGGFSEQERQQLHAIPNAVALALGPRILRADTAAVAALALVQATQGDWT